MNTCVVGIDASRNRSGGARHHLVGLIEAGDPRAFGIERVHLWAYAALLRQMPSPSWLVKHNPPDLERSLLHQAWWQRRKLPGEIRRQGCDILLSTDAGTIGVHEPSIVMSRDMLSYEPGEMGRYGFSRAWVRLWLLRHVQARSLKRARGAIFLTRYAAETIQRFSGPLPNVAIIPHGVGASFRRAAGERKVAAGARATVRCIYVSNAELYKHQWQVMRAVADLRSRGYRLLLTLAGGGEGKAQALIDRELERLDPRREFIDIAGAVPHEQLPSMLAGADLFVFASSCENMPNTLLEGMASGLPIACSDRGPMPELLRDGGVYFDPEDRTSIAAAIERLLTDDRLRERTAHRAMELSAEYSWERCARETWEFLRANA